MQGDVRISTPGASASRRELTVYDTPAKRSPEDEQRDRAKRVESHPFLYHLGQFVPGLRPNEPSAPDPSAEQGGSAAIGGTAYGASGGVSLWGREAANQLIGEDLHRTGASGLAAADHPPQAVPLFPAQLPAVAQTQPADPTEWATPVSPVEIPRIVMGQVDRMVQNGVPATTLFVKLDPPHLGKVDLAFTYAQQKVSVNVMAATQQAKDHLDTQLTHIRSILHGHNLPTGELKVVLASEAAGQQGGSSDKEPGEQPNRYRRRRRSAPLDEAITSI